MAQLALVEGSIFGGRYRIVRCIAMGGMGAVYEVIHLETERRRALKVMLPQVVGSEDLRSRFRQEARVAAHIESQHIVDVFDAGVDEATGMPFLVMELLNGVELGQLLKQVGRLPPSEVVTYIHQTALALDKTHRASIIHRDLKPANLFLTRREDGQPHIKVLDFGIAKIVADSSTQAQATQSMGTPLYMAPEQFRTSTGITPAADIYALGMMVFTLLVGKSYWADEMASQGNVFAFALTASGGPPELATARAAKCGVALPPAFDAWFAKATAVQPADRFPTAGAAAAALGEVLGYPVGTLSTSGLVYVEGRLTQSGGTPFQASATAVRAPAGSHRRLVVASLAAFCIAGGATVALVLLRSPPAETSAQTAQPSPPPPTASAAPTPSATAPTAAPTASENAAPATTSAPVPVPVPRGTVHKPVGTAKPAPAVTAKLHSRD